MTFRRFIPILLALLMLAVAAAGCGAEEPAEEEAAPPPPPETQSYRNDEEGFSLDLPADWEVLERGERGEGDLEGISVPEGTELLALSPEAVTGITEEEPAPLLTVNVDEAPDDEKLEEWTEATVDAVTQQNPNLEDVRDRIVSLPPGDGLELTFVAEGDRDTTVGVRQYVVRTDGKQYVLTFQTNGETLESDSEEFERIADSLKVD